MEQRRVRTPEGARFYGQPIGTIIALDKIKHPKIPSTVDTSVDDWWARAARRDREQAYTIDGQLKLPQHMDEEWFHSDHAKKYLSWIRSPKQVWKRGGVEIVVWDKKKSALMGDAAKMPMDEWRRLNDKRRRSVKFTDNEGLAVLRQMEWLQQNDPTNEGQVTVSLRHDFRADGEMVAYSSPGEPWIVMDPDWFTLYQSESRYAEDPRSEFMPEEHRVPFSQGTLAHEYGHIRDSRTDEQRKADFEVVKEIPNGLHPYGLSNMYEAYAEAYAEWVLSVGKTPNPAARWFAKKYNWPVPKTPPPEVLHT